MTCIKDLETAEVKMTQPKNDQKTSIKVALDFLSPEFCNWWLNFLAKYLQTKKDI